MKIMNSYDRIYNLLTEKRGTGSRLRTTKRKEGAVIAKKKRRAEDQGQSTIDAAEAHRMGKLAAGSMAAGNTELAKRQIKQGQAVKRGTSTQTRPSTVYGGR